MRIDFHDEFVMYSSGQAHDQFDRVNRKGAVEAGSFSSEAAFVDHRRQISLIIGHQTLSPDVPTSTER
ncbi:hypothetical protein [Burkholderia seminalis]|uniref:hypothetical protein n=1 Tax=Burkholderia seminalis TaxID=488731 RepID=UPI00264A6C14|nr:hypothetical protein [Burkholderia seminalis]MDN7591272.1 hypothetical protein [Burkholderia seminalis]